MSKKGKNPNYVQKKILSKAGKDWKEWLFMKECPDGHEFRHKTTNEVIRLSE